MAFWKSVSSMRCFWFGCIVMGLAYAFFMWDGRGSLAFVAGQLFMGAVGLAREFVVARQVRSV